MIHLRVRTEYSFGMTYAPITKVIARLKELKCTAAGIVDTSTWGHVHWVQACTDAGIQPMLGVECVVTDTDVATKMWFLATTTESLSELYHYTTRSHRQRLKTKFDSLPRLFHADVLAMSDGILKFAGTKLDGSFLKRVGAMADLNTTSLVRNTTLTELALAYALPLVTTSDNAYTRPEDKVAFEIISNAGTKMTPQWLEALPDDPMATAIAARCRECRLPMAPMVRMAGDLEAQCRAGIKARKLRWTKKYETRLTYELQIIKAKDYDSYFIVVADMVKYAKQHMLVGPSRGSAAGSLVCYLAGITEIDPVPPNLMFERFIDISRKDLPDIDLDFPDNKRHLVFEYMAEKYGAANVAHIGTMARFKPKSALIQVCKALGIPPSATGGVKAAMVERSSADARATHCLEDTFETTQPGKSFIAAYPNARLATELEGHASHTGTHAAGLLICNEPIERYATVDANGIAHIEKNAAETLGLLKIDVLGLRTLTVLEDSGVPIDWYHLPLTDAKTLANFNTGNLCGIFQFDGDAMRSIAYQLDVKSIIEVDAITALARPGPFAGGITHNYIQRAKGLQQYEALHPLVEPFMRHTYGLPIYQEQTLAIVREIGKFGWKEAAAIRKSIAKRMGVEFFNSYWSQFKEGAASHGIEEGDAAKIWQMIMTMGSWQMNRAHTYSYAVISYWTMYLKTHHPLEFAAATLRNAQDEDSAIELLRELSREGIAHVPFDMDNSQENWSVHNGKLLGGFLALKGIGTVKAKTFLDAREKGTLTPKQKEAIGKCPSLFGDIFPIRSRYQDWYDHPLAHGVGVEKLSYIIDLKTKLPHGSERACIGELVYKNPRNANEEANIKKRNGKLEVGPLLYMDLRVRDDTGTMGGRIGRFDWERLGLEMTEKVPLGAHLLIRAKFWNGFPYLFISNWTRLDV